MAEAPTPPDVPPPAPTYLPLAAYRVPILPPTPPAPTWTRTYEVATARRVVSSGLQLAVEASSQIRRASIYIGVLALGAFGPGVLLLLVGIARLMSDPATAQTMANDPSLVFLEQPEIAGPVLIIYALLGIGVVLLVAISIDAQAMAIAILGGRASDQPIRLWEAVVRARQVFWRLAGAGFLVGLASAIVAGIVVLPFIRPLDTNTGLSFIGSMAGALVVTPFAFASAGIVLGDVGATEALRRSMALFRARPRISLVVTLFTLVTSAIQTFAISSGADAAVRVGDLLHLNLEQGGLPLTITTIIVLAFIVAFGSLTFTIAAIVAAPQVTGFLGLTYYSGGLDKARSPDGLRPRRFRWVSLPMVAAMVGLLLLAGLGLPSVTGLQLKPPGALITFLRDAATPRHVGVSTYGDTTLVEDPAADAIGDTVESVDILAAEYGYLPEVPDWLLANAFDCNAENVACGIPETWTDIGVYRDGAYVFRQRMAGPPGIVKDGDIGEWGPLLALPGYDTAPVKPGEPYVGASHAIITFVSGSVRSVRYLQYAYGSFAASRMNVRSTWIGNDLFTIVPLDEALPTDPRWWDSSAMLTVNGDVLSRDSLRSRETRGGPLPFEFAPEFWLSAIDPFAT